MQVCCFGLFSLKVSLKTHCRVNPRKFGSVVTWLILHLKTCTSATPVRCCPCCGKQSPGGVHKLQLWLKATLTWERRPSQKGHPYLKITVFRKCPLVPYKWPPHYWDHACLRVCGLVALFFYFFYPVLLLRQTFHCKVLFEGRVQWRFPHGQSPTETSPRWETTSVFKTYFFKKPFLSYLRVNKPLTKNHRSFKTTFSRFVWF